jgi:hypothetical protein
MSLTFTLSQVRTGGRMDGRSDARAGTHARYTQADPITAVHGSFTSRVNHGRQLGAHVSTTGPFIVLEAARLTSSPSECPDVRHATQRVGINDVMTR